MSKLSRSVKGCSTPLIGFSIPKKSSNGNTFLRPVESGSLEEKRFLQDVYKTCVCIDYVKRWTAQKVMIIQNPSLENEFAEKKRELRQKPGGKILTEGLAFSVESADDVETICRDGPWCKDCRHSLGNPHSGVSLCRHVDVLLRYARGMDYEQPFSVVVYKIVLGRAKAVGPRISPADALLDPTPNFDCHTSAVKPSSTDCLNDLLERSMVYMYEYNESALPSSHPRHCIPFAVIAYHSARKTFSLVDSIVTNIAVEKSTPSNSDVDSEEKNNVCNTRENDSEIVPTREVKLTKELNAREDVKAHQEPKKKSVKSSLKLRILQLEYLRRNAGNLFNKTSDSSLKVTQENQNPKCADEPVFIDSSPEKVCKSEEREEDCKTAKFLVKNKSNKIRKVKVQSSKPNAKVGANDSSEDTPTVQETAEPSDKSGGLKRKKRRKKGSLEVPKKKKKANSTKKNSGMKTIKPERTILPNDNSRTDKLLKKTDNSTADVEKTRNVGVEVPQAGQDSSVVHCSQGNGSRTDQIAEYAGSAVEDDLDYNDIDFDVCKETNENVNYTNCDTDIGDNAAPRHRMDPHERLIYPNDVEYRAKSSGGEDFWSKSSVCTAEKGMSTCVKSSDEKARITSRKRPGPDTQRNPVQKSAHRSCQTSSGKCEAAKKNEATTYSYDFIGQTHYYTLRSELLQWTSGGKFFTYKSSVEPCNIYMYPDVKPGSRDRRPETHRIVKNKENRRHPRDPSVRQYEVSEQQQTKKLSSEEALKKLHSLLEECGKCEIDVGTLENLISDTRETANSTMLWTKEDVGCRADSAVLVADITSGRAATCTRTIPPLSDPRIREFDISSVKESAVTVPHGMGSLSENCASSKPVEDARMTTSAPTSRTVELGNQMVDDEHGSSDDGEDLLQFSPVSETESCPQVQTDSPEKTQSKITLNTYKFEPKTSGDVEQVSAPQRIQCNRPLTCPFNSLLPSAFQWKIEKLDVPKAVCRGTTKNLDQKTGKVLFEGRTLLKGGVEARNIPLNRVKNAREETWKDPRLKPTDQKPVIRITKRQPSGSSESGFSSLSACSDLESRLSEVSNVPTPKTEDRTMRTATVHKTENRYKRTVGDQTTADVPVTKTEDQCFRTVHQSHIMSTSAPTSDDISKRIENLIYSHLKPNPAAEKAESIGEQMASIPNLEVRIPGLGSFESNNAPAQSGLIVNTKYNPLKEERCISITDLPTLPYSHGRYDNGNCTRMEGEERNSDILYSPVGPGTPTLDETTDDVASSAFVFKEIEHNVEQYLGRIRSSNHLCRDQQQIGVTELQRRSSRWDRRDSKGGNCVRNGRTDECYRNERANPGNAVVREDEHLRDMDNSRAEQHCGRKSRSTVDARQRINEIKAVKAQTSSILIGSKDSDTTHQERCKRVASHSPSRSNRTSCKPLLDHCRKRRRFSGESDGRSSFDRNSGAAGEANQCSTSVRMSAAKRENTSCPHRGAGCFSNYKTDYPDSSASRHVREWSRRDRRPAKISDRRYSH